MGKATMTAIYAVWAVSFTGATWVSLVLGSRPEVLAVGNPERALQRLRDDPADACRIHRAACPLWPAFAGEWDGEGNPFERLARFAGKKALVLRNPKSRVLDELSAAGCAISHIVIVRDLRPLLASWMRKKPGHDIVQAIDLWGFNAARMTQRHLRRPGAVVIRHDLASADPDYLYARLSEATGRAYGPEQGRFWEHDHHIVAGNGGTMRTVIAWQQNESHSQAFYTDFIDSAARQGETRFRDERWRAELDRYVLYVIDRCLGAYQEEMGFERDSFAAEEERELARRFERDLSGRRLVYQIPGRSWSAGSAARRLARRALALVRS
jgi:hypothetical protein